MKAKDRFERFDNGHLALRGVDLVDLCKKYGTPLFVFDEACLRENYRVFHDSFSRYYPKTLVCYSIKTNYNPAICKVLREEGAYAAAASRLDLYVAEKAGFPPKHTILDGLYKSEAELAEAVQSHLLLINVESFSELERLDRIAGEIGVTQNIGIRVNFTKAQESKLSKAIFCHPSSRFGFSKEDAFLAFKQASKLKNLRVTGIMTHPYHHAEKLLRYVKQIQDKLGIKVQHINLGGGFGKNPTLGTLDLIKDLFREKLGFESKLDKEKESDMRSDVEGTSKATAAAVGQTLDGAEKPTIIFEPGRAIVGGAGILLLQVKCIKEAAGYKWAILDGGTNLIPDFWERREIHILNRRPSAPHETVNLVGPLLYPNDFIAIKKRLSRIKEGDLLGVLDSGAYSLSQSHQFLYPRPAAVLLKPNGSLVKIRERENCADVLRMDRGV